MKNIAKVLVSVAVMTVLVGASSAQTKKPAGPTCPKCHMALSATKTKTDTVPVKIGKKTYYCCAACGMKK